MIIKFLKPFSFLPAIFLMYMIFSFSAQDGTTSADLSYQVSYKIVEVGGEVLGADLQPWEVDQLATRFHTPVRKLAHMTEYFLLAISVAFPLYVYGLRGILLLIAAGAICVAFACGDEYHQAFVDGRGPSKRDVLIDSVGVFFGIVLVRIIGWTGRKTIFHPFSRKKKKQDVNTATDPYMTDSRRNDSRMVNSRMNDPRHMGNPHTTNSRMNDPRRMSDPYTVTSHKDNSRRENKSRINNPRRTDSHMNDPHSFHYAPYPANYQDSNYYDPVRYSAYPQKEGGPYGEPYYNELSSTDPYQDSQYPNEPYSNAPYYDGPYYDEDPYPDEDATGTSDRLSEDMSLRKLMSDLKDQKKARHKTDAPR